MAAIAETMTTTTAAEIVLSGDGNKNVIENWAGVARCVPRFLHRPTTVVDVCTIVRFAAARGHTVKVIGGGHSPSDIAMTFGDELRREQTHMISLDGMNRVLDVDENACTITVQAGMRIKRLNRVLSERGLALSCLGSISEQSLGGATSTTLHGSGALFGTFCTNVLEMELVDGHGDVVRCSESENTELFGAARCHLGCLGIVTAVKLQAEKAFNLHQVQEPQPLSVVLDNLPGLLASADHVRFWWFPHTDHTLVTRQNHTQRPVQPDPSPWLSWIKQRFLGYHVLEALLYGSKFVPAMVPVINRVYRAALFGKREERIGVSYNVFNFDCLFQQFVSEWAIPRDKCGEALHRLREFIARENLQVHFPVEVRFIRSDDIFLSPAFGRETCYIGIIMYRPYGRTVDYVKYFRGYERIMHDMGGRPHWAKDFSLTPEQLRSKYAKWDDFVRVRDKMDPHRVFDNAWVSRVFPPQRAHEHGTQSHRNHVTAHNLSKL